MPKAKQKSKNAASDSRNASACSDEENGVVPATQQSQSMTQAEKAISALKPEDVERKVCDLVKFFIISDQKKMPIKRQDINKFVLKENSRALPQFIAMASEKLENIFGVKLMEIANKKSYILVNLMETDVDEPHLEWPEEDNARLGLIMVILSTIFMSGNTIEETNLYATLKKLGVDVEQPHELFGDVKKLISQDFVKQGYVIHDRQGMTDPPVYDYKWGARARHETSKRNVLDFVCQIYGDTDPSKWTSQWQDMIKSEGAQDEDDDK